VVLYGALGLHFVLALWSLLRRRALKLSPWEWTQLGLGILTIPLGVVHVVGTRAGDRALHVETNYGWVLASMVDGGWSSVARQFSLPLVVWLHACIGLHFAWRLETGGTANGCRCSMRWPC